MATQKDKTRFNGQTYSCHTRINQKCLYYNHDRKQTDSLSVTKAMNGKSITTKERILNLLELLDKLNKTMVLHQKLNPHPSTDSINQWFSPTQPHIHQKIH